MRGYARKKAAKPIADLSDHVQGGRITLLKSRLSAVRGPIGQPKRKERSMDRLVSIAPADPARAAVASVALPVDSKTLLFVDWRCGECLAR